MIHFSIQSAGVTSACEVLLKLATLELSAKLWCAKDVGFSTASSVLVCSPLSFWEAHVEVLGGRCEPGVLVSYSAEHGQILRLLPPALSLAFHL